MGPTFVFAIDRCLVSYSGIFIKVRYQQVSCLFSVQFVQVSPYIYISFIMKTIFFKGKITLPVNWENCLWFSLYILFLFCLHVMNCTVVCEYFLTWTSGRSSYLYLVILFLLITTNLCQVLCFFGMPKKYGRANGKFQIFFNQWIALLNTCHDIVEILLK